jgi:hypothetical protein
MTQLVRVAFLKKFVPLALLVSFWAASFAFLDDAAQTVVKVEQPGISGPCDFVKFWVVSRMETSGQGAALYDFDKSLAWQRQVLPAVKIILPFMYPPPALLLFRPFALLPLYPAYLAWSLFALLASAVLFRLAALPWAAVLVGCFCPAALLNFDLGQLGLLTGAVTVAAVGLAAKRPVRAGVLAGLLVIKPPEAAILPVILARQGWRGLIAAVMVAGSILLASLVVDGGAVWHGFLQQGSATAHVTLLQPPPAGGASIWWMCRGFGAGIAVSFLAQAVASVVALTLCWRAWREPPANRLAQLAFTVCLGMIAAPYGLIYDLCGVSAALAALVWQERRLVTSDVLLWTWPVLGLIIDRHFNVELTPLVLGLTAWRTSRAMAG